MALKPVPQRVSVTPPLSPSLRCLARVGVHDRVNVGKFRKVTKVDFTDACNGGRPKCGGGHGVRSPADALVSCPDER